jgi:hypothetical protein
MVSSVQICAATRFDRVRSLLAIFRHDELVLNATFEARLG